MSKKIFLAAPFKGLVNHDTSLLESGTKSKITELIHFFEKRGHVVHNAHQREAWGKEFMTPEQCTKIDYEEIKNCDIFVAFPGIPASPGTHIEIGWASAFKKKIVLLLFENEEYYAYLVRGLHSVLDVKYIVYREKKDYLEELDVFLKEMGANEI
ncbi:nucleoside 2-deoxyribosyltransferase [Anaerosacchariphilus polymeriproducens]|uniref:DUF4406 domain-containing protein n=1 Tax=Anaerosacchariphilus polymeriproducens TaxID=1812858 RepID=A0A371ARS7_9FIRM|nr:nucleoside 2-deoxyribosyltransferase [Anaerosacchariphilus polymeriproducens]RDU22242.1 DUF4406 domain-containing protein [Anaerosacchariphilus polymeriproducens]